MARKEAKAQDLQPTLWPEGEERRSTIDGRALVERRRVLASGEEGEGASEGDPIPPEPPTWIGSGLGLGQVIPSDCARASIRSRGDGAGSQDRRVGGTHRLGGGSQSPRPKTFMHLTHFGPRAKSRDIPSTAEPWSRDAECWPPVYRWRGSPRGRPISTRATDHPSHPQSLCESQHPLQRRRGWVAGPRRIAAQVASVGIGEEMSRSPRPPSDSPWPEGEEQRYTIDGRALVKRRRVLASGIEGEGAPEGDPTWLGLGLGLEPRRRLNSTRATPTTQAIPSHCARASTCSRGDGARSQDHVG